ASGVISPLLITLPFIRFILLPPLPPISPLFPYTTLFRSADGLEHARRIRRPERHDDGRVPNAGPSRLTGRAERDDRSASRGCGRSEEHTSELQSRFDLVCRLLLEKKKTETVSANMTDTRTFSQRFRSGHRPMPPHQLEWARSAFRIA